MILLSYNNVSLLHVVGGILWRGKQFLAAQRPQGRSHAGYWEFPGGKVELGENLEDALIRELKEELAITITDPVFFHNILYDYGSLPLSLHFFHVTKFIGEPKTLEGQILRWLTPTEANNFLFLDADRALIKLLQELKTLPTQKTN